MKLGFRIACVFLVAFAGLIGGEKPQLNVESVKPQPDAATIAEEEFKAASSRSDAALRMRLQFQFLMTYGVCGRKFLFRSYFMAETSHEHRVALSLIKLV
jgi:hypothetical protein